MVILAAFTTPKRVTRLIVATELAVDNTVFDLTGPRYEPQTYRSRDECVTASSLKLFTLYTTNYSVVTLSPHQRPHLILLIAFGRLLHLKLRAIGKPSAEGLYFCLTLGKISRAFWFFYSGEESRD